jgi:hypothetical protein
MFDVIPDSVAKPDIWRCGRLPVNRDATFQLGAKRFTGHLAVYNVILDRMPRSRTMELPEFPAYVRFPRWRPLS